MSSFAELGVSSSVSGALARRNITEPFAVQRIVMKDALDGRDVLVQAPTGSGKTLAFGIPMVERIESNGPRPAGLVLAPTRELAAQIVDELHDIASARALKALAVYGGVGLIKQARLAARSHIIVATPGRLEDQLARGAFTLDAIKVLVLDEADRMLDMGFRPAVERVIAACPKDRQTLFFSATLDGDTGRLASRHTLDARHHEDGGKRASAAAMIEHRFLETTADGRIPALVQHLNGERDLTLVFVRTKHGADRLVKRLDRHGVRAIAMHGDKSQRQRERALAQFQSGSVDALIATDVAARGIDVEGISHVVNYDMPHDPETYIHRVGRTGRAGRTGIGITFVTEEGRQLASRIATGLGIAHTFKPKGGAATEHGTPPRRRRRPPHRRG